jgi:hypothetical protein
MFQAGAAGAGGRGSRAVRPAGPRAGRGDGSPSVRPASFCNALKRMSWAWWADGGRG